MRRPHHHFITLVWLAAVLWWSAIAARAQGTGEFEWRFSIKQNQTASSNITAHNACRQPHRFEIVMQGLPAFMRVQGETAFLVPPLSQHVVPVQFDSTGQSLGQHEGQVVIHCLTCRTEKTCSQDYQRLHIYMNVEAAPPPAPAITTGTQSRPKNDQPISRTATPPTPTPTPAQPPENQAKPPVPPAHSPTAPAPPAALVQLDPSSYVPNRVLAIIAGDSLQSADATAKKLARTYDLDLAEIQWLESIHAALVSFALRGRNDVPGKVAALLPQVLLAQPDFIYKTSEETVEEIEIEPDPPGKLEYGPKLIGVDHLRGSFTGKDVTVALIDTGVDTGHPALAGKIAEEADMTGKGFTADVHATLLAGIIASEPKAGAGISGIAPGARLLAIKACEAQSARAAAAQCWSRTLARGVDLAIERRAGVINMSLGGPAGVEDPLLKRMVDEAVNRGALVVAAAGNDGARARPGYPAALSNVVAVTAVDSKNHLYASATQGNFISLAAPGVEIISTSPGGRLLVSSGTSLATAFVSGTAALALQQQSRLSPRALQTLLERTAQDLGPPGKDPQFGNGLVNACRAVAELKHDSKLCR
ncbi:MAG TPA: S8 family serine peptidase [Candidatus Angelobacter sp.]|nr:S8 family serine peptidase [Candidatus Angelobacter sp.]